ncbi:hypothetical protein XENOCAPTIV_030850, partial [Xenoophorus captivus]
VSLTTIESHQWSSGAAFTCFRCTKETIYTHLKVSSTHPELLFFLLSLTVFSQLIA